MAQAATLSRGHTVADWLRPLDIAMVPTLQTSDIPVRYRSEGSVSIASLQHRDQLLEKLELFSKTVESDIDAPSDDALRSVRELINALQLVAITDLDVFMAAEGGIACAFSSSTKFAQLEILNKGNAVIAIGVPSGIPSIFSVEASRENLLRAVEKINSYMAE